MLLGFRPGRRLRRLSPYGDDPIRHSSSRVGVSFLNSAYAFVRRRTFPSAAADLKDNPAPKFGELGRLMPPRNFFSSVRYRTKPLLLIAVLHDADGKKGVPCPRSKALGVLLGLPADWPCRQHGPPFSVLRFSGWSHRFCKCQSEAARWPPRDDMSFYIDSRPKRHGRLPVGENRPASLTRAGTCGGRTGRLLLHFCEDPNTIGV